MLLVLRRIRTSGNALNAGGVEGFLDPRDEVANEDAGDHAQEDGWREQTV